MSTLRVSAAQLCVMDDDIQANIKSIEKAIDNASQNNADILVTPEGSLSGYHNQFNPKEVSDGLAQVTARAKEKHLGLALGTCFREADGKDYNQVRIYDKNGEYLGFHSKILKTSTSLTPPYSGEIANFETTPLRTFDFHGITIGALICNDMWANPGCSPLDDPHLLQKLAQMGAKVVFHAVNGGRAAEDWSQVLTRSYHESNLRLRALAGKIWVVTCDNAYPPQIPNSCSGGVIGPDSDWRVKMDSIGVQQCYYDIDLS